MSCCFVGVNAFRSGAQIVAQRLSSRTSNCPRLRWATAAPGPAPALADSPASTGRYLSSACRPTLVRQLCDRGPTGTTFNLPNAPGRPLPAFHRGVFRSISTSSNYVVITSYIDLPPDYKDKDGLPFSKRDMPAEEVVAVFGSGLSTTSANRLLRILHGRRVAGTLEDPEVQVHTCMYSSKARKIALEYLRMKVHVDEVTNAGLRAEDELAVLEGTEEDGVEKEGTESERPFNLRFKLFKEDAQRENSLYGKSAFDAIRARNLARREEMLKRQEEEEAKRKKEQEEAEILGGLRERGEMAVGQVRVPSAKMQEWLKKGTSDLEAPPEMTKRDRILPSAVVVCLVTSLLVAYATYYRPLKRSDRLFPDIPPAAATVGALVLANLAVYIAWRIPPLWPFLNRYFILTSATPVAGSLFGSMFSHHAISHLATNMLVLWLVGTRFHDDVGRGDFLATYVAAGSIGFLGSLASLVLRNQLLLTSLGASGAVYGVTAAYFWMHRFEGFKLFGLPPDPMNGVPGLAFIGLVVGLNVAAMFSKRTNLDVASHLTGLAVGMAAGRMLELKKEARRREREEKMKEGMRIGVVEPVKAVEKK